MRVWIPVPILKRVWDGYTHTDDLGLVEGGDRRIAVGCQVPGSRFRKRPCHGGVGQRAIEQDIQHPSLAAIYAWASPSHWMHIQHRQTDRHRKNSEGTRGQASHFSRHS